MSLPPVIRAAAVDASKVALARRFRRCPTPAEATAWTLLRGRRILGLKFRRQQVIDGFVADFYCAELRLALELDGAVHDDPARVAYDALRTEVLFRRSIDVVRLRNADLSQDALRDLLAPIVARRRHHTPHPLPSPDPADSA